MKFHHNVLQNTFLSIIQRELLVCSIFCASSVCKQIEQVSQLSALVHAQVEYHSRAAEILTQLSSKIDERSVLFSSTGSFCLNMCPWMYFCRISVMFELIFTNYDQRKRMCLMLISYCLCIDEFCVLHSAG